jgi:hypothetical protein
MRRKFKKINISSKIQKFQIQNFKFDFLSHNTTQFEVRGSPLQNRIQRVRDHTLGKVLTEPISNYFI